MRDAKTEDLIEAWVQDRLDAAQFAELERRLREDPSARAALRRAARLDTALRDWAAQDPNAAAWLPVPPPRRRAGLPAWLGAFGLAAAVVFAAAWWSSARVRTSVRPEATDRGCAILTQTVDHKWETGSAGHRPGDTLKVGSVGLQQGLVQIEFFSGATVLLEGPAELEIVSSWEAICRHGKVRVRVPPAANGFRLRTPDMMLVDLGTEFAAEVNRATKEARVQVFDGAVEAHTSAAAPINLKQGQGLETRGAELVRLTNVRSEDFVDGATLQNLSRERARSRFASWESFAARQRADARLIAFYGMNRPTGWERLVRNEAVPGNSARDGGAVGAHWTEGRWPGKGALEFKRPGDRVRLNLDGTYEALTMSCWVRVDGLDRLLNALFLTDGYDPGEPHWQILQDGRMMFSLIYSDPEDPKTLRNQIYYSPPIFDRANTGRWHHLAVAYDNRTGVAVQYVDGVEVSGEVSAYHQSGRPITFGSCEIGNWGIPLPKANFPIRNLNGRLDEFAIYAAALTAAEIDEIFQAGKPE